MASGQRISFDGSSWHTLVEYSGEKPTDSSGGCFGAAALCLVVAAIAWPIMVASPGEIGFTLFTIAATIGVLVGGWTGYLARADYVAEVKRGKLARWGEPVEVKILEVKNANEYSGGITGTTGGAGIGVALGGGIVAGGGLGKFQGKTHLTPTSLWRFYTDSGPIAADDRIYTAWLLAGKPDKAWVSYYDCWPEASK
ncbi:MAG: hypothetical protein M3R04_07890 [bacterium]|nr:hypothetical protein [bacterium]